MDINKSYPAKSISYGSTRSAGSIKYLVFHYTGNNTDTARNNAYYFGLGGSNTRKAGAHYFVDDTSVYQSISDDKVAYSVGIDYGGRLFGTVTNTNSISIEMCSTNGAITEKTMANAVTLGKEIMKKYNIPLNHVVRHYDVCGKECPGWSGWYGKTAPKWDAFLKRFEEPEKKKVSKVIVKDGGAIMRRQAGKKNPAVGTLEGGVELKVLAETENWVQVEVPASYVAKKNCEVIE